MLALWNALRERTGDPALQLAAPASLPFGAYRVIDYLVGASATVGAGVERFARFFQLIAEASSSTSDRSERACLCLAMADGGPVPPVYVDYVFAALVMRVRMRIRPGLRLRGLELRRPEPAESAAYFEAFRAPVRFGGRQDMLCFDDDVWNEPMDTADGALAEVLEEHARSAGGAIRVRPPPSSPRWRKRSARRPRADRRTGSRARCT